MELKSILANKSLWVGIIVAIALTVGLLCKYAIKTTAVVPVEIVAEKIIDKETGVEFDFNPSDTNLIVKSTDLITTCATNTGGADKK